MKWLKTIVVAVFIGIAAWNSIYFEDLQQVRAARSAREFNATQYADVFWSTELPPYLENAVDLSQLADMLTANEAKTFDNYSHALGIGNLRYFLVRGRGVVRSVRDDNVVVTLPNGREISLATELIFGNAVRDATGLININEFTNTMDFNNVSAEINKIIRESVLPPFRKSVKDGDKVSFVGAIELNREHVDIQNIEVIPVQLNIID